MATDTERAVAVEEARAAHHTTALALERAILFRVSELLQFAYPGAATLTATTNREYDGSAAVTVETVVDAAGTLLFNIDGGSAGDPEEDEEDPENDSEDESVENESDTVQEVEILLAELVEVQPGDYDKENFEIDLESIR